MSMRVEGIKPPDEKWKQMKAIYDACVSAKVLIPAVVEQFFDGYKPNESGVAVDLINHDCSKRINGNMIEGYEIDLAKLPKDVKFIQFTNSY